MAEYEVRFDSHPEPIRVPAGTLLVEVAQQAGIEIQQPCGGQGRCGRCAVIVESGQVRRRSILRLSKADVEAGYALACQTVIEGDASITVPPPEAIQRRLTTDHIAPEAAIPEGYDASRAQSVRRVEIQLTPPSMDDQTDDWGRLCASFRRETGVERLNASLDQIRQLGATLRSSDWHVALTFDTGQNGEARLIRTQPADAAADTPLCGLAIDIGTTTVTVWMVDLLTGQVMRQASEYNQQIARGEDVISRIIYASKGNGGTELREMVLGSINGQIQTACERAKLATDDIVKATITGNSTMMVLLLGIPADIDVGIAMNSAGVVDPLPGVASYVGADITAGVLSSELRSSDDLTLFIDAIEEVWIDGGTYEPDCRVIGNVAARGICGSGLISLVAEMFLTGLLDKGGNINETLDTPRVRRGRHGPEYVIAWAAESDGAEDIVIARVDIDNLLRAKAAIYAGFIVLANSVGVPLETAERVLIGGSFGKYINVEKAVQIGLLPDMPWERFHFLGNTSVKGAYLALIDSAARDEIAEIASAMTYIELSADNTFYEAFTSALFLPHTDLSRFPSVEAAMA
ncbi:MAG: DUF4445 domain-containing protein [Deltaproteobacteria bacterium]|nr:DUF4445 domain-containing protein [Deltaproteobacteria bacterium]